VVIKDENRHEAINPLGQAVDYHNDYQPSLLFPIERFDKRSELGLIGELPFSGEDIWNAYELSWLNLNGLPRVGIGEIRFPASSRYIIESKSFKLYLNSLNQKRFSNDQEVVKTLQADLSNHCGSEVRVKIKGVEQNDSHQFVKLDAICIDDQDICIREYDYNPDLLISEQLEDKYRPVVHEKLCSHLLKSNCLITNQPDWASIFVEYSGPQINHVGLLKYLVSFRTHNEFHEQCVERIYVDIMKFCEPEELTVFARYTRRGGLDINPWRSNVARTMDNYRLARQ